MLISLTGSVLRPSFFVKASGPLEELVHRLKEGELEDVLAVLYPGDTNDTTTVIQILNTHSLRVPLVILAFRFRSHPVLKNSPTLEIMIPEL